MYTFITVTLAVIALLSAFLLCAVILVQNNKGGGGLGAVSGGVSEAVFGATAGSALVKITIWVAVFFLVSTLLLATITGRGRRGKSVAETLAIESAAVQTDAAATTVSERAAVQTDAAVKVSEGAAASTKAAAVEAVEVVPTPTPAVEAKVPAQK